GGSLPPLTLLILGLLGAIRVKIKKRSLDG
ncbi:MAG: GlyGly-CTERM sorting domain-containing protein, partial [Stenotrophobium sp.]